MENGEIFTLIKKNITENKFLDDKAKQLVYHSLKKSFKEVVNLECIEYGTGYYNPDISGSNQEGVPTEIPDFLKDIFKL